jgi:hypothetical protein
MLGPLADGAHCQPGRLLGFPGGRSCPGSVRRGPAPAGPPRPGESAHPRTEHFAPLFVALGAGENDLDEQRQVIEGFWGGLAKRSLQLG